MENVNTFDSLLFLGCARMTLKEAVPGDEAFAQFVLNEASDYEIMHAIIREDFPEVPHNAEDEAVLFEELQEVVDENYQYLSEHMDNDALASLIEIGPISDQGVSSSYSFLEEAVVIHRLNEDIVSNITNRIKDLDAKIRATANPTLKNKLRLQIRKLRRDLIDAKKKIPSAKDIQKAGLKARVAIAKGVHKASQKGAEIGLKATEKTMKGLKVIGDKTGASGIAKKLGAPGKMAGVEGGIGVLALAALLAYGAYRTYKRFFSKAATACKGKSGSEKTACMNKFKVTALNAQIKDLQAGSSACAKTKNPAKCKAVVAKKVAKLKAKVAKYS